jgi:hypothetical protein
MSSTRTLVWSIFRWVASAERACLWWMFTDYSLAIIATIAAAGVRVWRKASPSILWGSATRKYLSQHSKYLPPRLSQAALFLTVLRIRSYHPVLQRIV